MALTLSAVEDAIEAVILHGQAWTVDGTRVTRADLENLRSLRRELQAETDATDGESFTVANIRPTT